LRILRNGINGINDINGMHHGRTLHGPIGESLIRPGAKKDTPSASTPGMNADITAGEGEKKAARIGPP